MRASRLLDRALSVVGLQRAARQRSFWTGAGGGRLNADWILGPTSADQEIRAEGRLLRLRARELRRNNPLAARFVRLQVHGILGPDGVTLRAVVPNSRGGQNAAVQVAIETAWRQWGAAATCDAAGVLSWRDVERLAVETWKADGDCLVQMLPGYDNGWGFALQMLDPDQLDDSLNRPAAPGQNAIRMGVEVDRIGRPVAYHLWTAHPSELGGMTRQRIPAEFIVHLFTAERPGQTRGVTRFAPVMVAMKMLGGVQEALLVLMRTAACKMGFLVPNDRYDGPIKPQKGDTVVRMDAEPGLIDQLPQGFDFANWDPGQPGDNYEAFTLEVKRDVAAGLDVSHAALTGNLSQANYGSQRVGMTLEREGYKRDGGYLVRALHDRVFTLWMQWAVLSGRLQVPATVARLGAEVAEWQLRSFDWIDPEKDIDAALKEVDAGLNSLTRVAASKGRDFADVITERQREREIAAAAGVELVLHKVTGAAAATADTPALPPSRTAPVRLIREEVV